MVQRHLAGGSSCTLVSFCRCDVGTTHGRAHGPAVLLLLLQLYRGVLPMLRLLLGRDCLL
jgi:hypothetical protein